MRGEFIQHNGRPAVRFVRIYSQPREKVWEAITEPSELARWFPSQVKIEPTLGGTVEFSGDPNSPPSAGKVLIYEPPKRLAFSWGGDELHFELSSATQLVLINVLEAEDTAARNAAGWHVCLAELTKHLHAEDAAGPHSPEAEDWRPLYESYVQDGMPSGAPIPGGN